jgi:hypothetical protein
VYLRFLKIEGRFAIRLVQLLPMYKNSEFDFLFLFSLFWDRMLRIRKLSMFSFFLEITCIVWTTWILYRCVFLSDIIVVIAILLLSCEFWARCVITRY